jgi:hypothetical protein
MRRRIEGSAQAHEAEMTDVFAERHWDRPLTADDMRSMIEQADGCLAIHRAAWHGSLLSADGQELLCHFTAPDAESIRIALRQAGPPHPTVWAGTIHYAPGVTESDRLQANVLVTRQFAEPTDLAALQAIEDAGAGCLQMHRVRFIQTFLSTDRRRMCCLYQAPDAESVRIAQHTAGMPLERVFAFRQFRR